MSSDTIWELPFSQPAELELHTEWGNLTLVPVEAGQVPRLELTRGSAENVQVQVEQTSGTVRVGIDPQRGFNWFGGWECRATVYVPQNVHAHVQTNAGSVSARDLTNCELGIKANAGKIDLTNVHGLLHLSADAGSVTGREVGGYFDVETQAGSVRLDIDDLAPGEHRIRASMGSVLVSLGRGMDVCVESHTSLGSVRNRFPSRATAPAKLILTTEMGSVRVEESAQNRSGWRQAPSPAPVPPDRSAPASGRPTREDPELDRILKMVEAGELSAQDADELLRAMGRV